MKIGILTFVNANNYGAVLQAYASQKFINDAGFDAELINYTPLPKNIKSKVPTKSTKLNKLQGLVALVKNPVKFINGKKKALKINDFKNKLIKISPNRYLGEISELKEPYDIIFAGSDQIWNTDLSFASKTFFLNFKTNARKVGYAISVGRENLTDLDRSMIHNNIGNFEKISVREKGLKDYLLKNENIECQVVCDPVFLLSKEIWNKLAVTPRISNYILVYAMECNTALLDIIAKVKSSTGKKVVFIYGGEKLNKKYKIPGKIIAGLGPLEFIGWIKKADIVITNSFHGAAFSIIFDRPLIMLEHSLRNDRLLQLAYICGCKEKIVELAADNIDLKKNIIDSTKTYKNLDTFIAQSKDYIMGILQE